MCTMMVLIDGFPEDVPETRGHRAGATPPRELTSGEIDSRGELDSSTRARRERAARMPFRIPKKRKAEAEAPSEHARPGAAAATTRKAAGRGRHRCRRRRRC